MGELHRKRVLYQFGSDYGPLFAAANRRARKIRGGQGGSARLDFAPESARGPSVGFLEARTLSSPKSKDSEADRMLMDEIRPKPPAPSAPSPPLEAALERWTKAFEESRQSRP